MTSERNLLRSLFYRAPFLFDLPESTSHQNNGKLCLCFSMTSVAAALRLGTDAIEFGCSADFPSTLGSYRRGNSRHVNLSYVHLLTQVIRLSYLVSDVPLHIIQRKQ